MNETALANAFLLRLMYAEKWSDLVRVEMGAEFKLIRTRRHLVRSETLFDTKGLLRHSLMIFHCFKLVSQGVL